MGKTVINGLAEGTMLRGRQYDYKILRALGQGTFGITYLAELRQRPGDGGLTMRVAIKEFFMREVNGREGTTVTSGSRGGVTDKYRKKFVDEALKLNALSHEGIVRVVEQFEANGTVYYAMEYIDGGSLDQYIASKGHLSELATIGIGVQLARALEYMHGANMLHLDMKPSNVMLRGNRVVLIDFGLSKQYDEHGNPESSTSIGGGTPGYAPLEQTNYYGSNKGQKLPVTMDVYALGATLFKMFSGRRPPEASDILNNGFPVRELAGASPGLTAIIRKAMAVKRTDRYPSVLDMHIDLQALADELTSPTHKSTHTTTPKPNQRPAQRPRPQGEPSKPDGVFNSFGNVMRWINWVLIVIALFVVVDNVGMEVLMIPVLAGVGLWLLSTRRWVGLVLFAIMMFLTAACTYYENEPDWGEVMPWTYTACMVLQFFGIRYRRLR